MTEEADTAAAEVRDFWWWAIGVLAVLLVLVAVAWSGDVAPLLRVQVYREQFLGVMLALSLGLVFLHIRADRRPEGPPPVYDIAAAVLGLGAGLYLAAIYPVLAEEIEYDPLRGHIIGGILFVLLIEALRRVAGTALTVIVIGFVAYGLLGHLVPGRLAGLYVAPERLLVKLTLDTNGLLGTPLAIASTIVVIFVLFGTLLNRAGGAQFFTDLSLALMGRYRGGAAKISILASSLFGSISGSAVSNVATTGIVTIPLMRKGGFRGETAAGIEAVASTGGQLMPPIMGASAFLMATFLEIGYGEVVLAALFPAVLYYVALFIQADLRAARAGIDRVPEESIPRAGRVMRAGWAFPLPFVVLIVALFWWNYPADKAGLVAIGVLLVVAVAYGHGGRRMGPLGFLAAIRRGGIATLDIVIITGAAGLIIGVLNASGLSFGLTLLLVEISQSSLFVLLAVAALISIVLGMGMPTIGVYVLLAALVAPSIAKLGVEPIAAHLFVLYFGMMSMITPPVAIAAFAAASLGRAGPMLTAWEAMRFGWPAYVVPFLFVLSPSLLLIGSVGEVALAVVTAVAGVWLASVGLVGFLFRRLGPLHRVLFAGSGLALLVPATAFEGALYFDIGGALVGAALTLSEWRAHRAADNSAFRQQADP